MKHAIKLLSLALASTLNADQFSFQLYNDFFAGTDQYFTNGLAISWLDDSFEHIPDSSVNAYSNFMIDTFRKIAPDGVDLTKRYSAGVSLSQITITPADTTAPTLKSNFIENTTFPGLDGNITVFVGTDASEVKYSIDSGSNVTMDRYDGDWDFESNEGNEKFGFNDFSYAPLTNATFFIHQ